MSRVNVDSKAFTDIRFKILGRKLGRTEMEARGLMLEVWAYCTNNETHYVSEEILSAIVNKKGFCKFAQESDLLRPIGGKLYVCGTSGRIEWIQKLRENSKKGGEAKARKSQLKQLEIQSSENKSGSQKASQFEARMDPKPEPEELPGLCPLSLAPSLTLTNSAITPDGASHTEPVGKEEVNQINKGELWKYYAEQLKTKHGITASRGAKEFKLCKSITTEFGMETAKRTVDRFLNETDRFVTEQAFQIGLLYSQRQKYSAKATTLRAEDIKFIDSTTLPNCGENLTPAEWKALYSQRQGCAN